MGKTIQELTGIVHLSPSTAQSYRTCGKAFYFKKVLGIPDTTQYHATHFGSALHQVLEKVMTAKLSGDTLPLDEAKNMFVDNYSKGIDGITVWGGENPEHMIEQGWNALEDFYDNWLDKYEPLYVEKKYSLNRGEGHLPIVMIMDLVTKNGEVIDYKTGRSSRSGNYLTNMTTYAYCYYKEFGTVPRVKLLKIKWTSKTINGKKFYFFKEWEEEEWKMDESWFDTILQTYDMVEYGMKQGVYLPAEDNSGLCKQCSYRLQGYCDVKLL